MNTEYTPCEDPECYGLIGPESDLDNEWLDDTSDRYEDSLYSYAERY